VLKAGGRVTLRTGLGKNAENELFWGSSRAIWNDNGDTVFIRDASGNLVLVHVY
jgi:competence protein ComEC